jgi:hypothetical protein
MASKHKDGDQVRCIDCSETFVIKSACRRKQFDRCQWCLALFNTTTNNRKGQELRGRFDEKACTHCGEVFTLSNRRGNKKLCITCSRLATVARYHANRYALRARH